MAWSRRESNPQTTTTAGECSVTELQVSACDHCNTSRTNSSSGMSTRGSSGISIEDRRSAPRNEQR